MKPLPLYTSDRREDFCYFNRGTGLEKMEIWASQQEIAGIAGELHIQALPSPFLTIPKPSHQGRTHAQQKALHSPIQGLLVLQQQIHINKVKLHAYKYMCAFLYIYMYVCKAVTTGTCYFSILSL